MTMSCQNVISARVATHARPLVSGSTQAPQHDITLCHCVIVSCECNVATDCLLLWLQAAGVCSRDIGTALGMANKLRAGTVWVRQGLG